MSNKENKVIKVACMDCGTLFEVSEEEQKWYEEKGYKIPKRCQQCRKARRMRKGRDNNGSTEV